MSSGDNAIELNASIWLEIGGTTLGGRNRVALLEQIAASGSIVRAAKAINLSYKAAWDAIDAMNNLAGEPLVAKVTGGKGGGGTRLTRRGEQLVENFKIIERAHQRFVSQLQLQADGIAEDLLLIRTMAMKTSARNQFLGKVKSLTRGSVNDEISLEIAGGQEIIAIITHESTENLGLAIGGEAFALVKSSSIILVTDEAGAQYSARNRLTGTISRIQSGAVNTEVIIDLSGGGTVAAVVTNESTSVLGLAVGNRASAIFKASSVIVAVPA